MRNVQARREQEKRLVSEMIALYCRKKHGVQRSQLCPECKGLPEYAMQRSDRCPFEEEASEDMKIKKYIFIALGCLCLGLGTVGVFLPVLPTTPFYLLTVFFFANSSQKLHDWFLGTKLYQKHLDSFVKKSGMLRSTKISIVCTVTLLMGFGFFMMARKGNWIPCIILAIVWLAHILYFTLRVKTIPQDKDEKQ